MPRIPDDHLRAVVFIYPTEEAARRGDQVGGTGFVVTYGSGVSKWRIRHVVTNAHVVEGRGGWVRLNSPLGPFAVHIPWDSWHTAPPDDLAVAVLPLPPEVTPYEMALDSGLALTREEARSLNVGPGDEVYMLGRFAAHGGQRTNNPIARFGSISLMPTADELVHDGRGNDVEAYLIEMRSQAGFSGSPVLLLIPQYSFRGVIGDTSFEDDQTKFRLVGILAGTKIDWLDVEERDERSIWTKRDDLRVRNTTGVAIVVPIWKVIDLLERDHLVEERLEQGHVLEATHQQQRAADAVAQAKPQA